MNSSGGKELAENALFTLSSEGALEGINLKAASRTWRRFSREKSGNNSKGVSFVCECGVEGVAGLEALDSEESKCNAEGEKAEEEEEEEV